MCATTKQRRNPMNKIGEGNRSVCACALAAAAICAATLPLPSYAADRTISTDYMLTADETVDGVLTVDAGPAS